MSDTKVVSITAGAGFLGHAVLHRFLQACLLVISTLIGKLFDHVDICKLGSNLPAAAYSYELAAGGSG